MNFQALILYMDNAFLEAIAGQLYGRGELAFIGRCFALSPAMRELLRAFVRESRAGQPGNQLMLESLCVQAAILLLREGSHSMSESSPFEPHIHPDEESVKKAIAYIADNYQNRISLFEIADETHYSPYHFLRIFKRHTGRTPFGFLLDLKIGKAKEMLRKTDCTISQICDLCGFSSLSYFSRVFREKTGLSPSQFRSM
ncbi:MAG: helix-turn-helix transcriptional regulator [Clostridiales bacterium]|nr:helix-turn-helix transcriptional regulator [Clostridiales bacterium]